MKGQNFPKMTGAESQNMDRRLSEAYRLLETQHGPTVQALRIVIEVLVQLLRG